MQVKQDPVTGLYCRSDGAVLMPPCRRFPKFRWTFGSLMKIGYRAVRHCGEPYLVHRIVCRAFNGLPPADKPFVDHINRIRHDNRPENLRWVSYKENNDNTGHVDQSIEKYGVRQCDDRQAYNKAYMKAYYSAHQEELRAYYAAKAAEKKAQGLSYRRGPDGKWGWYPRKHLAKQGD